MVIAVWALAALSVTSTGQAEPVSTVARSGPTFAREALRAFQDYRTRSLKRATITWSSRNYADAALVVAHYTSRLADGDQIFVMRGDNAGTIGQDSFGNPTAGRSLMLRRRDGERWTSNGDSLVAHLYPSDVSPQPHPFLDISAQDASPKLDTRADLASALSAHGLEKIGPVTYSCSIDGNLYVVSARASGSKGTTEYRWHLDHKRGWSPVRVQGLHDGKTLMEARITPKDFDGVWFPEAIARFRSTWEGGRKPYNVVTVHTARFGGDDLPRQFGPTDIGVEVGTNIVVADGRTPQALIWDGAKPSNADEVFARIKKGELTRGPHFVANSNRPHQARPAPANPFLQGARARWEQYVDLFAQDNALSDAQRSAARGILEDCLKQAEESLRARKDDINDVRRLSTEGTPPGADGQKQRGRLMQLQLELTRSLQPIFDQQLRPRLDALLTKNQANKQDQASQPVGRNSN